LFKESSPAWLAKAAAAFVMLVGLGLGTSGQDSSRRETAVRGLLEL
jgi:hypothetical protein